MSENRIHISVLIPAYNAGHCIGAAAASVLCQTFQDFELIICDDASTDNTLQVLQTFDDSRIKILRNETNLGIAASRNKLLREARGQYIAWLDADDTMQVHRLEKQWHWMQANPETDILSSYVLLRGYKRGKRHYPGHPEHIRAMLLFKNIIVQPAVMSRNFYSADNIWYNETRSYIEDYDLWTRLMPDKNFGMISEYLTSYAAPLPGDEHLKRQRYGWYAHYDLLLSERLQHHFPALAARPEELERLSFFLRTYERISGNDYHLLSSLLYRTGRQLQVKGNIDRQWLQVVLLYLHLLLAKRYRLYFAIPLLLRFSPLTWWRFLRS